MRVRSLCVAMTLAAALYPYTAYGAPAAPVVVTIEQPDGTTFDARARGDEFRHWMETVDGYTVVESQGTWYYAIAGADGELASSGVQPGSASPGALGIAPGLAPPAPDVGPRPVPRRTLERSDRTRFATSPHTQPVLVILLQFADISFDDYSPDTAEERFADLMFGASASVKEYFDETSYGNFDVVPATESYGVANNGVVLVTLGSNHPNDPFNVTSQIVAAFQGADPFINYAAYDTDADGMLAPEELSIVVIFAGYENAFGGPASKTPRVWGHMWAIPSSTSSDNGTTLSFYTAFGERHATTGNPDQIATIGIMAHELGHLMFGLPDLYDTDSSSQGIGNWGLMGGGSWNGLSRSGDTPAHMNAWSKAFTHIIEPTIIQSNTTGTPFANAAVQADAKMLWVDKYRVREGFLIENRQLTGYDAALPGAGLQIWHIDGGVSNNANDAKRWVDLEEADGLNHLDSTNQGRGDAGDPFPGTSNNRTFNAASNPNSNVNSGAASSIAVTNISDSMATMTADLTANSEGATGDHVRYDDGRAGSSVGYSANTVWTALRVTNDTAMDLLEGFEVNTRGNATVDFYLYETLTGTTPTTLLHSQAGYATTPGWNRLMLTTPQSFPPNETRVMVLRIVDASAGGFPAVTNGFPPSSGRTYVDFDGVGAFSTWSRDLAQVVLLGSSGPTILETVYVDFSDGSAPFLGTQSDPYNSLDDALSGVEVPGTIVFTPGSSNWTGTINQEVALESPSGAVSIGGSP